MTRGYYFGAGPAVLPLPILKQAQQDILEWRDSGVSILEMGHRTPDFRSILEDAEASIRRLLKIPDDYHVLFLNAPARLLFSMIPMNFISKGRSADYFVTGIWSQMAYQEAQKLKKADCIASSEATGFTAIPDLTTSKLYSSAQSDSAYFYYTPNETVNGVYCSRSHIPNHVPVIADMTSSLLTEPLDINAYDLIFAGAQKNIANAGMTLVIIRDSFAQSIQNNNLPTIMDFRTHIQHRSLYTTPATFNCYLAGQMFAWVEAQGGVDALYSINQKKARLLYDYIDQSSLYSVKIEKSCRSFLNVCFQLADPALEETFAKQAQQHHLLGLAGHRTIGGLRASLYNAMPLEGVEHLIEFMRQFESVWRAQK